MTSPTVVGRTATAPVGAAFRPDIEGLRAVAIGLVLIYHAGVRQLPGGFVGVDVFFVISGFLITGLLIRELERTGRISLRTFYARRAKRLLPATGVVLVVTAVLTAIAVPVTQWRDFAGDIVASALYVTNWRLAARSVDYLAEDVGTSPVQHFWSLAVEEQFYVVWPLLLVALAWWLRRTARRTADDAVDPTGPVTTSDVRTGPGLRPVLAVGITAVIVPSFITSVVLTAADPALAFFVTPTRLWELGVGALVAIGSSLWPRIPRPVAVALGWAGLATVVGGAVVVTSAVPWPGAAALVPTLGTAAVIVGGYTAGRAGPAVLLSWRPAVWIGGLSYSLYLWHWPLLTTADALWGEAGARRGLLVVAVSVIPAYLCHRLVENPIRFSDRLARSRRRIAAVAAAFTAAAVVAGVVVGAAVPGTGRADGPAPGATVLADDPRQGEAAALAGVEWFVPSPADAEDDLPAGYADDCQVAQRDPEPRACVWGDPDGDTTIAVVGDSKMLQWQSALDPIAKAEGWRIVSHTKSACAFQSSMQASGGEPYTECAEWGRAVLEELLTLRPAAVITSHATERALDDPDDPGSASAEAVTRGMVDYFDRLAAADIPVITLLDNPSSGRLKVFECTAEHPDALDRCTFDRSEGIDRSAAPPQRAAVEQTPGTALIDMQPWICPERVCLPVIGNVLIYRQNSHLTDTYVRSLERPLADELRRAMREIGR